ncbi:MAG: antibiotic transporter [Parachlamydiaceae bacterium]|nr:antibiotic transporter [Parachlamydiaceae bacterium]
MSFLNLVVILFLIMDPVGNISSFIDQLNKITPTKRKLVIVREMLIALVAMVIFHYIGEYIFKILTVSETTVRITIGVILFLTAIKIMFPRIDSVRANLPKEEPFINPLAIPLIAGPSLLATVMLFSHLEPSQPYMLLAIFVAWCGALIILLFGSFLQRILGNNGLMACERLMAMVLALLAIQRFLEGIKQFVKSCI